MKFQVQSLQIERGNSGGDRLVPVFIARWPRCSSRRVFWSSRSVRKKDFDSCDIELTPQNAWISRQKSSRRSLEMQKWTNGMKYIIFAVKFRRGHWMNLSTSSRCLLPVLGSAWLHFIIDHCSFPSNYLIFYYFRGWKSRYVCITLQQKIRLGRWLWPTNRLTKIVLNRSIGCVGSNSASSSQED